MPISSVLRHYAAQADYTATSAGTVSHRAAARLLHRLADQHELAEVLTRVRVARLRLRRDPTAPGPLDADLSRAHALRARLAAPRGETWVSAHAPGRVTLRRQ